jgi:hypothetical protein
LQGAERADSAGAKTSAKNARLRRVTLKRTTESPGRMCQASIAAISAVVIRDAGDPGIGPRPKMNNGASGIGSETPMQITIDGKSMLPVPRTLARPFMSQTGMLPAKTILHRRVERSAPAAHGCVERPPEGEKQGRSREPERKVD